MLMFGKFYLYFAFCRAAAKRRAIIQCMYSGTTFRSHSGNFIGVHQKIDRIARRDLRKISRVGRGFPSAKDILHFEGNNGPDGIKRKSPGVDEPWHFIDPSDPSDTALVEMIMDHYANLVQALKKRNNVRAAFEAAWMAHAITDGLTPAHHYPLGEKIEELWGRPQNERASIAEKGIIRGSTMRETLSKNWEYWGAKGVFATHLLFELGVATSIKTTKFPDSAPNSIWLKLADDKDLQTVFLDAVQQVYALGMYEEFWKRGWTTHLAQQTRQTLIPLIANVITYFWYRAYREAHQ